MNTGIKVVDHTTDRAYETIAAASKELYISCSALRKNRRRKGNRFTFYDHDLEFIVPEWRTKREGYKAIVKCLDTGVAYPSITSAAKAIGISVGYMARHLTGDPKTIRGHKFERMDQ